MRNADTSILPRLIGAGLALACAIVLASCGGDDAPIEPVTTATTTTTTGGTLSQDDFIASADPRCAEANAAIANLGDDSTAITQERSITEGLLDDLQAIGDGDDPDGSLADYYAALQEQARILKQQETATSEGDVTTVSSLEAELDAAKADAAAAAEQYGFVDCGGSGTTLPDDGTGTAPGATTTTPAPATPTAPPAPTPVPVDPGGTGGGTPVTPTPPPTPTPTPPSGGGGSGGVAPG